ncbi:hypothetical protein LTR28_011676 [Elasticomyces elasticus]|nr:hypothetical protein LTR28_011676 [Elasticomyces elasticus]
MMAVLLRSLGLVRSGRRGHLSVQLSAPRTRIPRVPSDLLESGCWHSNIPPPHPSSASPHLRHRNPTTHPRTMCKYYAHTHPCGHTKTVFAAYCPSGALVQRPCGRGEIWQTLRLEASCLACGAETEKPALKVKTGPGKRGVRR